MRKLVFHTNLDIDMDSIQIGSTYIHNMLLALSTLVPTLA